MSILRSLAAVLVVASSALAVLGCAPPGVDAVVEDTTESEDAAVAFEVLDAHRADAEPGLTVIRSRAAYREHFGEDPPEGVAFNKHWVLHYAMGTQPTGGYATEIASIERAGSGSQRTLIVTTIDTAPGYGCMVTQAMTSPQIAVRINKHNGAAVKLDAQSVVNDCEPRDFCPVVRCNKGTYCDEEADACLPGPCDPSRTDECGPGLACQNLVRCVTAPCFEDWRCHEAPEDPCQGLDYAGSCDGSTVRWCEDQAIQTLECGPDAACVEDASGFADCG